ncbi:MAG: hypothetical protein K0S32_1570 [Bacteroidetes bacterium]|nr:hypothetical protein [Bacteroidota bacterium]
MPTFRVSFSKQNPPALQGVYDYAQTVVAADQNAAVQSAYQSWTGSAQGIPPLQNCYVNVTQTA